MSQKAYSVRSAAAAYEVSETTVRDAINKQQLPAHRVGRAIRIHADDMDEWFRALVRVGSEEDQDR
ncbi:MAG TPA: helix-turn-helix domain-containing protein [Nocardioides sp.]|uniref:helix-turn-helix domain-containing protein n=1 Tax=Nocardioides sp. TaxID=35761 RepID=UPI002EDAC1D9